MTTKHLFVRSLAALILVLCINSCSEDSNPSDSNSPQKIALGTVQLTANGAVKSDVARGVIYDSDPPCTAVECGTAETWTTFSILLQLPAELSKGNFNLELEGSATTGTALMYLDQVIYETTSGKVNITDLTDSTVAGTFNFSGMEWMGEERTVTVTNGAFNVRRPN